MMNLSNLLRDRRKRNDIKKYIMQLGPLLARTYGKAEHYSPERVRKTLHEGKFPAEEIAYALVLYCTPEQFAADQVAHGEAGKYWPLHTEIVEYDFRFGRDTTPGGAGSDLSPAEQAAVLDYSSIGDGGGF